MVRATFKQMVDEGAITAKYLMLYFMDDLVNGLEPAIDPTESFRDNVPAGFHTGLLLVLYYLDIPRLSQCLVAYTLYSNPN
jgi:hypothetical protein